MFLTVKYIDMDTRELIYQEDTEKRVPDNGTTLVLKGMLWNIDKTIYTAQYTECYLRKCLEP